jgi:hypothetical protein
MGEWAWNAVQLRTRTFRSFAHATATPAKLQRIQRQPRLRYASAAATIPHACEFHHRSLVAFAQARLALLEPTRQLPREPLDDVDFGLDVVSLNREVADTVAMNVLHGRAFRSKCRVDTHCQLVLWR